MAYNKKMEYGPGYADITSKNVDLKILCGLNSNIKLNGLNCVQNNIDVDELYSTLMETSRGK